MGYYGTHYALSKEQADKLCDLGDEELFEMFFGEEGPRWEKNWVCGGDKFWDGLHRCLTDGTLDTGLTPLHSVILGEDSWFERDDYYLNVLNLAGSHATFEAVRKIDRDWLRAKYDTLDQEDCDWHLCEADFEAHWLYFKRVRAFFRRAVAAQRWIAFAANFS